MKGEKVSGLAVYVPESGLVRDAFEVATTAAMFCGRMLAHRFDKPPYDWNTHAAARHAVTLHRLSGQLQRLAQRACNEDLTCQECLGTGEKIGDGRHDAPDCTTCAGHGTTIGRKLEGLRRQCREIAEHYGMRAYFQTDPRGCALYLIDPATIPADIAASGPYTYPSDAQYPPSREDMEERWIGSNYNRGHAVTRLGR